jgi:hypothetical protein
VKVTEVLEVHYLWFILVESLYGTHIGLIAFLKNRSMIRNEYLMHYLVYMYSKVLSVQSMCYIH